MKQKTIMIVTTVVALVYGITLILIPSQVYNIYGNETNALLNYMGQLFGAALIGIGLISWRARNAEPSESLSAIFFGFLIADFIGFVVALVGQLQNIVNLVGWVTVLIYLLLSLGFGYLYFQQTGDSS